MARSVKFNFSNTILESTIVKVDRSKLYGSSKKIVRDLNGDKCVLSSLYNGDRILPKGSISQILLNNKGFFVNRSDLVGFNSSNEKVEKVSSIFSIDNKCEKVELDEFLSVNVKSIYQLSFEEEDKEKWNIVFANDEIYHFIFNYREDFEGDDAYLISNGEDFFITVGKKNDFEFLEQSNIVIDEEEEEEIDDELDFSMF
ncbi:MAG: hypothetical protein CMC04_04545 [Flavobacteriaceae bacterium]|jgi:hypothetical protein|nr:hypothetical protein [Flavobacteriaceae bacterium]|tara:strand:- start:1544 stop:2143 length:600 start_codon:yes stop_codon:yes gene_type:complete